MACSGRIDSSNAAFLIGTFLLIGYAGRNAIKLSETRRRDGIWCRERRVGLAVVPQYLSEAMPL